MSQTITSKPSFLASRVGGLPRTFWVLWSGSLLNRLGTMVEPFIGVYLTQARGYSLAVAGMVMAVFGAGALLSQPIGGWLADRVGRRATLTGGMLASAAGMLALGYSTSLPGIVAAMFVVGLALDAYRPASQALVADIVSSADRPRAYGLLFWAINMGFAVSMTAGGFLAQSGILWLFWINAVASTAFGVLVWLAVPETRTTAATQRGGFGHVLRDRLMVVFVLLSLGYTMLYSQAFSTLPLAMLGSGLTTAQYGVAMAINGLLIVIVQPIINPWLARRDPSLVLATGMAVVGVGFALHAFMSTMTGYLIAIVIWTAGEVVTAGIAGAIVATLAPPHLRGRYMGLYGFAWSGSALIAPLLGTWLLSIGPVVLWLTMGSLGVLAAAGQLAIAPAVRRRAGPALADPADRHTGVEPITQARTPGGAGLG
ncbi:Predicted arabinose efflux permease, MFS family [Sinosporangium album]|uniref:Predicted arabinose efflux permease, MFS family n=1 Tax=Sinosporangium album TaxID=504805 RepID=A0A1G7SKM8_9ACTN|nr:MFS transporter [Sinosporangium album]SDG22969.1 Predicted arabinose efflux permease, MFS family [Sinosporangium album]